MPRKVYIIDNLDCANCAAKIEKKFNDHKAVQEAVITFSTKQLRLTAEDPDALIPELTQIARTVEGGVEIYPRDAGRPARKADRHDHHHDHKCGCGHHHEHHDHDHKCGCGHHHEHHDHDHECGFGHHHEHHDHDHECGCGHHHEHHEHDHECGCGHHHEHHDHDHECGCGHHHEHHSHDHEEHHHDHGHGHHPGEEDSPRMLLIGAFLFVSGLLLSTVGYGLLSLLICFAAYVLLGRDVVKTALRNLTKGHVFDENFLMSIATIGAFLIGEYPEAVGVMLFYRVGEYFEHRAVERSRKQIMEAVDLRPEVVHLVKGEEVLEIPAVQNLPLYGSKAYRLCNIPAALPSGLSLLP